MAGIKSHLLLISPKNPTIDRSNVFDTNFWRLTLCLKAAFEHGVVHSGISVQDMVKKFWEVYDPNDILRNWQRKMPPVTFKGWPSSNPHQRSDTTILYETLDESGEKLDCSAEFSNVSKFLLTGTLRGVARFANHSGIKSSSVMVQAVKGGAEIRLSCNGTGVQGKNILNME